MKKAKSKKKKKEKRVPVESPLNARERSYRETGKRIVEAAKELMAINGVENTSIAAIAEKAEVATGTVFFHFEDKEGLISEIVFEGAEDLHNRLQNISQLPFSNIEESVRRHTETIVGFVEGNLNWARIALSSETIASSIGADVELYLAMEQEDALRRGMTVGYFRQDISVEVAAQAVLGLLMQTLRWWIRDPRKASREIVVDTITKLRLSGLHADTGVKLNDDDIGYEKEQEDEWK